MSIQVLRSREVPLGGVRALDVRRTLPHKDRSFVGAWCFVDHYGPCEVGPHAGMDVPPHPHTGLATVSWLFSGEIQHRDSGGVVGLVRPGEVNLMTAGHGIAHSEISTDTTRVLHGVQLWIALPSHARDGGRAFQHHVPDPIEREGLSALVFIGSMLGVTSPVQTSTPLIGAQLDLEPNAQVVLDIDARFEHALLLDIGTASLEGHWLDPAELGIVDNGPTHLTIGAGPEGARVILLGGMPFEEEVVMWWNFMGTDHDTIARAREEWQAQSDRFGLVPGDDRRLPAPPLPPVRLRRRHRLSLADPPAAS